jgi:hypothetical protein
MENGQAAPKQINMMISNMLMGSTLSSLHDSMQCAWIMFSVDGEHL